MIIELLFQANEMCCELFSTDVIDSNLFY